MAALLRLSVGDALHKLSAPQLFRVAVSCTTQATAAFSGHAAGCECPAHGHMHSGRQIDLVDMRRPVAAIKVSKPPKKESRYMASLQVRVDKIQANLKLQDKKIADYKKTLPPKASTKGILQYIKKNAWEKE